MKKLIVENKRRMDSQRLQRRSSTSEGGGDDIKIRYIKTATLILRKMKFLKKAVISCT